MLLDELDIVLTAGHGGPGKLAPIKTSTATPVGGDGGRGGDIYVSVTSDLSGLNRYSGVNEIKAEDGHKGGMNGSTGKSGADIEIVLPIGTSILDKDTDRLVLELTSLDTRVLLCKGGIGGRGGNFRAQPGRSGQRLNAKINLRLIADYGFIGLPNAGKSSLLNELTNADARVGAYPFTTLEPNLGAINGRVIADIPGLIAGASAGRGLGIKFLKHIEKVSKLFHCIAADTSDIIHDYETISQELSSFGQGLEKKPKTIVLTKTDLVDQKIIAAHKKSLKKFKHDIFTVSIYDPDSLDTLRKLLSC